MTRAFERWDTKEIRQWKIAMCVLNLECWIANVSDEELAAELAEMKKAADAGDDSAAVDAFFQDWPSARRVCAARLALARTA